MSYTKNTWVSGDVITAEKLNRIEEGVADASNGDLIDVMFEMDMEHGLMSNYTPMDIASFIQAGKSLRAKFDLPVQNNVLRYETSTYSYSYVGSAINSDACFFFGDVKVYAYDNGDSISWTFENY